MTLSDVVAAATGGHWRTTAWVITAVVVVVVIALVVIGWRHSRDGGTNAPGRPAQAGRDDRYVWGSDLYWRSYEARDVAPHARRAMELPEYHDEALFPKR
jgi:hypothetical protein